MNNNDFITIDGQLAMTSFELAEASGKTHAYIMNRIRKDLNTWLKGRRTKCELRHKTIVASNGTHRTIPYFVLNGPSYSIVSTRFKDETRIKLKQYWEQFEKKYNEISGNLNDNENK